MRKIKKEPAECEYATPTIEKQRSNDIWPFKIYEWYADEKIYEKTLTLSLEIYETEALKKQLDFYDIIAYLWRLKMMSQNKVIKSNRTKLRPHRL